MNQALKLTKMSVSTTIATRIFNPLLRRMSTTVNASDWPFESSNTDDRVASTDGKVVSTDGKVRPLTARKDYIIRKINHAGSTGGTVADALRYILRTGQKVTSITLFDCFKDLRRKGHYQQCLEILDWLDKGKHNSSGRDITLRIDILHKLKGITEAEKYFDSIPSASKNSYVYRALFMCYCNDLKTDKALAIFKKMDEMGFALHTLAFNNVLNLYLKIKQPEKVLELISEMKKKHVPLDCHTYSYWIRSNRLLGDLEGVEQVFDEAQEDVLVRDDWLIYSNAASAFIEAGQFEKASSYLKKLEDVLNISDNPSRTAYEHLISLYAGVGKLESVIQSWNTLKSKFEIIYNQSYLALLQALSKLDDIKGIENYFREWESTCKNYDGRVLAIPIGAYLRHDMLEEANLLLQDAKKKPGKEDAKKISGNVFCFPHVQFMNYYFEKGQTESALKHMEAAVVYNWKPFAEKLDPCFQHFKDRKDVDGLEKFCQLLKRVQTLDTKAYLWLLRTYVDAEKTAPDMRERIEENDINVTPELEELLEQVCPN